MIIEMNYLI